MGLDKLSTVQRLITGSRTWRKSSKWYTVVEAISSLIFAASRCGELHELQVIRNLFRDHFGQDFERKNVQLLPGNAVSSSLTRMHNRVSLTLEQKLQLLEQIKEQYQLHSVNLYTEQTFTAENNKRRRLGCNDSTTNSTTPTSYIITNQKTELDIITNHARQDETWNMKSPSHVHPNLPDYDDLVTQFRNLKKQHVTESLNHRS